MQFIKAGHFKMGSPKSEKGRFGDEGPPSLPHVNGKYAIPTPGKTNNLI